MNDLISKYFENALSEKEKKELFSLLKKEEELKKEFKEAQNIYGLSSWLSRKEDIGEGLASLSRFKKRNVRNKKNLLILFAYAASIFLAVIITKVTYDQKTHSSKLASQYEEFVSPYGQHAVVKLRDGSMVWLNSNTTLKAYPMSKDKGRRVELDGEAYFEVAHDEKYPFTVSTKRAEINVLGTKFNVFAYNNVTNFSASLIEGSLRVTNKGEEGISAILRPDEKAEIIDGKLIKSEIDKADVLSWKDGIYTFENMTLTDIANRLEVYYGTRLVISDESLSNVKFSGKFRQGDRVENILKAFQTINPFVFERLEDGCIEIKRK
ncbi:MAG: FecR domain-containing protein [Bacteroidales bacterium]|nr:FecR domain-containing protein [Bacteroidales bacterium]MDY6001201.1 FecR domain-containing protein [Candidatus Cryptobacteroides sp.]